MIEPRARQFRTRYECTCQQCKVVFWSNRESVFCDAECRVTYTRGKSMEGRVAVPDTREVLSYDVKRLQNKQRLEQKRRAAKAELDSITYNLGGHTDAEREALRAELEEKVRCGRSVLYPYSARGATE